MLTFNSLYSRGLHLIHYPLLPPPKCWDYSAHHHTQAMQPGMSSMVGKHLPTEPAVLSLPLQKQLLYHEMPSSDHLHCYILHLLLEASTVQGNAEA